MLVSVLKFWFELYTELNYISVLLVILDARYDNLERCFNFFALEFYVILLSFFIYGFLCCPYVVISSFNGERAGSIVAAS